MADNANTGTAYVSIDGQTIRVVGELTWDAGTVDRETQKGMDGIHGKKITPRVSFISLTIRDSSQVSIGDLNTDGDDVTVFAQLISGKNVTGRNMWQTGPTEINSEEGTGTIRWEGAQGAVQEELAA